MASSIGVAAIAVITLSVAGCGSSDTVGGSPPTTAQPLTSVESTAPDSTESTLASSTAADDHVTGTVEDLGITEVAFEDHVTITNLGEGSVTTDGLWLCNRPFYVILPPVVLAPGESVDVSTDSLGGMPLLGGEAALYRSDDFESAEELLDYVAWGRGGGRGRAAAEAQLWPEGDVVEPSGSSIVSSGGGSSPDDWRSP